MAPRPGRGRGAGGSGGEDPRCPVITRSHGRPATAWLDHNLGDGTDITPVMRLLEEQAFRGEPLEIGLIGVHTSDPREGDAMVAGLGRWHDVRRVVAHSFLAPRSSP